MFSHKRITVALNLDKEQKIYDMFIEKIFVVLNSMVNVDF